MIRTFSERCHTFPSLPLLFLTHRCPFVCLCVYFPSVCLIHQSFVFLTLPVFVLPSLSFPHLLSLCNAIQQCYLFVLSLSPPPSPLPVLIFPACSVVSFVVQHYTVTTKGPYLALIALILHIYRMILCCSFQQMNGLLFHPVTLKHNRWLNKRNAYSRKLIMAASCPVMDH